MVYSLLPSDFVQLSVLLGMPLEQLLADSPRALEVLTAAAAAEAAGSLLSVAVVPAAAAAPSDGSKGLGAAAQSQPAALGSEPQHHQQQQLQGAVTLKDRSVSDQSPCGFAFQARAVHVYNEAARVQRFRQVGGRGQGRGVEGEGGSSSGRGRGQVL
jgi:hypothetical protein